jgi:transposase InsO family protein
MGGRKLYFKLKGLFEIEGIKISRDRFFNVLRQHKLLIKRRRNYCRTTNSNHRFRVYDNLVKDKPIIRANQVWVSDLTYIDTREGYLYLSLITDAYSRKIIGYEISDSLQATGCLRALNMALKQRSLNDTTIHHSDRGIQYCSHAYIEKLSANDLQISMTEENHCYENALAERLNGILKTEYWLGKKFSNKYIAITTCKQAIRLYNTDRPHLALNLKTPEMAHRVNH